MQDKYRMMTKMIVSCQIDGLSRSTATNRPS